MLLCDFSVCHDFVFVFQVGTRRCVIFRYVMILFLFSR